MSRRSRICLKWSAAPLCLLVALVMGALTASNVSAEEWRFGVLSDTQWTTPDDGQSPNTIPAGILKQVNQLFISQGVKVVIDVGDSVDVSTLDNLDARALFVQNLYNAGIAYYPLRGNHEAEDPMSGLYFARTWPQIGYILNATLGTVGPTASFGWNNATPPDILLNSPTLGTDTHIAPPAKTNTKSSGWARISPTLWPSTTPTPAYRTRSTTRTPVSFSSTSSSPATQHTGQFHRPAAGLDHSVLSAKAAANPLGRTPDLIQAFVFAHKNLLGGNHKDNLFGATSTRLTPATARPARRPATSSEAAADAFISALGTE